jgi:hypothetical protein
MNTRNKGEDMYTEQDLLAACVTVLGVNQTQTLLKDGLTAAHEMAALAAFRDELHGDDIEVLRMAMIDRTTKGVYAFAN